MAYLQSNGNALTELFSHTNKPARHSGQSRIGRPGASLAAMAVAVLAPTAAYAQQSGPEADAGAEIIVTGERMDIYDVLPDRASSSVFGTSRELAETPRSVTLVESSLIDLYGVRSVNDFVNITAGTCPPSAPMAQI